MKLDKKDKDKKKENLKFTINLLERFINLKRSWRNVNDAMLSFLELVNAVAPYSLAWGLGIKAYKFIVGTILGKDMSI